MNGVFHYFTQAKDFAAAYLPSQETLKEKGSKIQDAAGRVFAGGVDLAIKGAVWYQGYGREKHLHLLQKLWNRKNVEGELDTLSIPLTRFFEASNPELYAALSQGNQNTFKNMIEGLILYMSVNCAAKLYPEKMERLKQKGEIPPEEAVPFEVFCADLMAYAGPVLLEEWLKVDNAYVQGMPIRPYSFSPLVDRLLDLVLPQQESSYYAAAKAHSNRAVYRQLSQNSLKDLFHALFLKTVEKGEPAPGGLPIDLIKPLLQNILPTLIRSLALSLGPFDPEEERRWVELTTPLVRKLKPALQNGFPAMEAVSENDLAFLASALCIRAMRNLTPPGKPPEESFDHLLLYVRDQFFICFQSIRRKRALNQEITPEDFLTIAKILMDQLLFDQPAMRALIQQRASFLLDFCSSQLMQMEASFQKNLNLEPQRQHLRELFWDRDQFQKEIAGGAELPEKPTKELSELFKVEEFIKQMEMLCKHVGFAVADSLKAFARDPQFLEGLENQIQLKSFTPLLQSAFHLLSKNDWQNGALVRWLQDQIAGILFSILTLSLSKGAVKSGREQALFTCVEQILTLFLHHMPERKNDPKKFKTLSRELIVLLFETADGAVQLDHYIPLPGSLAVKSAEWVKASLLPEMLQLMDREFLSLAVNKRSEKKKLGNRYLDALSITLGKYVRDFVPSFLEQEGAMVSASLVDELKVYLCRKPEQLDEGDFEAALEQGDPHPMVAVLIKNCLVSLSQDKNPVSKPLFELLGRYTESILRRCMIHFSRHIKQMEVKRALMQRPQVEVVKDVLVVTHAHMERVNQVTNNLRAKNSREVPDEVLFEHFRLRNELHPLLNPQDPAQSVTHIREFSRKLNALFGLKNGDELPAPEFFRALLNEWIQHLMPIVWQELLVVAKSPDAMETYLHSLLVSIQKPLEQDAQDNPIVYEGAVQEEIELVSGKLLQELIGLHPTIAEALIRYRGVSELIGRAVGQSLRGALENYSVQELLNQLIRNALPALHPGRWITEEAWQVWKETGEMPPLNPAAAAERFFPLRKKKSGEVDYGWDFNFPRTSKAKQEQAAADRAAKILRKKKVRQALKENIEQQAKLSIDAGAHGLWNDFQKSFDQAFAELFGADGTSLKKVLDRVCSLLWSLILQPLLKIAAYPLKKLLEILLGYYCAIQARARVHEIAHPIHQNAILRSFDSIINFLSAQAI